MVRTWLRIRGRRQSSPIRRPGWPRQRNLVLESLEDRTLLSFLAPIDNRVGRPPEAPQSAAVGDFNGDGNLDLVAVTQQGNPDSPGNLSVLLGNGDGTFQPAVNIPISFAPFAVAVGDFNGDGNLDVVATDSGFREGNTVTVLLGTGDGTFQSPRSFAVGRNPEAVTVGDVNGDGIADIVTANIMDNTVSVLLGNGDGSFRNRVTYPVGVNPRSVSLADLRGDGRPDIVTANEGFIDTPGGVSVLLNNGDGTFQPATDFSIGSGERDLAPEFVGVTDFNGDGIPDIATANTSDVGDSVSILLGTGDGTFLPARRMTNTPAASLAVGDVNGDGIPDLVTTDRGFINVSVTVDVLLGNGDGTFRPPIRSTQGDIRAQAFGDFNGDGRLDLAALESFNSVTVLPGNGDGTFLAAPTFATDAQPQGLATADFNGDGIPDLVSANRGGNSVSILLGTGDGTFQPARNLPAGNQPVRVVTGDFNGDGIPDVLVLDTGAAPNFSGTLSLLLGTGDGSFQAARPIIFNGAAVFPKDLIVADFNGDGKLDVAISEVVATGQRDLDEVDVLLGNGDGTFQAPRSIILPIGADPRGLAVGDINGDGIPDLAIATHFGVTVLLGTGDGTFGRELDIPDANEPQAVAISDLNGDGAADLIVTHSFPDREFLSILLGRGDGTFQAGGDFPTGAFSAAVVVGDVNGDGIPDLVVANQANSDISVLLGVGDGTFQPTVNYLTGIGPQGLVVADFNGDGAADIAVTSSVANDVSVLLNQNDGLSPRHGVPRMSHRVAARPGGHLGAGNALLTESIDLLRSSSARTGNPVPLDPVALQGRPATGQKAAELDQFFLTITTNAERERRAAQPTAMRPQFPAKSRVPLAPQEPEETLGSIALSPMLR